MNIIQTAVAMMVLSLSTLGLHYRLYLAYKTSADHSEEAQTKLLHNLSKVTMGGIILLLSSLFASQDWLPALLFYFPFAIPIEISQGYLRGKVMKLNLQTFELTKMSARSNGFFVALYLVFYGIIFLPEFLNIKGAWTPAIFFFLSIFLVNYLSPILFGIAHKTVELTDPVLLSKIHSRLAQAGLPKLRIDVWPLQKFKVANAMVIGRVRAPAFLRARIVLTDSLIKDFSEEEIDAIVTHEVSHFVQSHLPKRTWIPLLISMAFVFIFFFTLAIHSNSGFALISVSKKSFVTISTAFAFICLIIGRILMTRQLVRSQELDADWMALNKFGVSHELYFSTLDKLVRYSGESTKKRNPLSYLSAASAHPTNEERRAILKNNVVLDRPPFERKIFSRLFFQICTIGALALMMNFVIEVRKETSEIRKISTEEAFQSESH